MTPEQEAIVAAYRVKVVTMFRAGQGGFDYPHHLKHGEQWYKPEEWDDQGNYYGPVKPMMPAPVSTVTNETTDTAEEIPEWAVQDFTEGVKDLLKKGKSISQIAEELGISRAKVQRLKKKQGETNT